MTFAWGDDAVVWRNLEAEFNMAHQAFQAFDGEIIYPMGPPKPPYVPKKCQNGRKGRIKGPTEAWTIGEKDMLRSSARMVGLCTEVVWT